MKTIFLLFFLIASSIIFSACMRIADADIGPDAGDFIIEYDFENGLQGWRGDVCDYHINVPFEIINFRYELAKLPANLNGNRNSLKFSFDNVNSDLFAYATTSYEGLRANQLYEVSIQIETASKYPTRGAGDIIFVKGGATSYMPMKTLYGDYFGINILKGNHGYDGEHLTILGSAAAPFNNNNFQIINLQSRRPVLVQANNFGQVWFTVGFDSLYAAPTELYIGKIRIFLRLVR